MVIEYRDLLIDLGIRAISGNLTDREQKMLNKLCEWESNDSHEIEREDF